MYVYQPYPRMLYKELGTPEEKHLIVKDEQGEAEARENGWSGFFDEPESEQPSQAEAPEKPKGKPGRKPKKEA